ncbi:hypothetical protein ES705_08687 [subsurface metagenome]
MTFERWSYKFDGPHDSPNSLQPIAGVYVISCGDDMNEILDVGEAEDVRDRVSDHDRSDCWEHNCTGTIYYSVHYMPFSDENERRRVEQEIRRLTDPPCGER